MLHAYFDASTRPSGVFAVAGYAFAKEQLKRFDKEWWKLFGRYGGCHMKDLTHGTGGFKGLDTTQTGYLVQQATKIISKRISFGISISCNLEEIHSLLPRWIQGFEHAYPVCCHVAMMMLGTHIRKRTSAEEVSYFFEAGDPFSASAHTFMEKIVLMPTLKSACMYHSHSFIGKGEALSLQAADLLAWEWGKYWDETVMKRKRVIRKSLVALLGKNNDLDLERYQVTHLTGEPLKRWAEKVAGLGLLQIKEDHEADAMKNQPFGASPSSSSPEQA